MNLFNLWILTIIFIFKTRLLRDRWRVERERWRRKREWSENCEVRSFRIMLNNDEILSGGDNVRAACVYVCICACAREHSPERADVWPPQCTHIAHTDHWPGSGERSFTCYRLKTANLKPAVLVFFHLSWISTFACTSCDLSLESSFQGRNSWVIFHPLPADQSALEENLWDKLISPSSSSSSSSFSRQNISRWTRPGFDPGHRQPLLRQFTRMNRCRVNSPGCMIVVPIHLDVWSLCRCVTRRTYWWMNEMFNL